MSKKEDRLILSDNLRYYIKEKKVSRKVLAEAINVQYSSLCDWSRGRTLPKYNQIRDIADYLKIPITDLTEPRNNKDDYTVSDFEILQSKVRIKIYCTNEINSIPLLPEFANFKTYEYIPKDLAADEYCFGFKVFDDSMNPEYTLGNIVIVKPIKIIDEVGDYLLIDKNNKIKYHTNRLARVYYRSFDNKILVTPLVNNNLYIWLSEIYTETEFYKKYDYIGKVIRIIK